MGPRWHGRAWCRIDSNGNILVTGNVDQNGPTSWRTVKYDGAGNSLWARDEFGSSNAFGNGVACDPATIYLPWGKSIPSRRE